MPNPLLPRLTTTNQVTTFGNAGRWEKREPAELERISEGLDVADTKIASAEVDSIPSMWARPLLFEMALYDTRHPMHPRILGEWRGLLALLALKEWGNFPLKTDQINITDVENPSDAKDFLRALEKLRPKDTLDKTTTWETLNIILFNDKPIGITSPTTLVCTAANYFGHISRVPWFDGRFLNNPVSQLNNFEKEAAAGWLQHLYEHIGNLPDSDDMKASLRGLLHDFIDNLGGTPAVPSSLSHPSLDLTQALFKCMNRPVAPRDIPSSIELVPSKNKQPETPLLVFDEGIPAAWGVNRQDVSVWQGQTLGTSQSFSGKPKLPDPTHVHLRRQQDFFTDELFVINGKNAFHAHSTLVAEKSENLNFPKDVPVTPILPITEELLTYFDVSDLNNRISFDQQNDSIVVRLRLTLSGINGENRDFVISKEYDATNVTSISTGPVLAIWPNFRNSDWKAYYTYFTTDDQVTFYAKPFRAVDEKFDAQTFSDNRGNVEKEITKTERFPEAILCEYNGTQAGILLISVPEEKRSVDGIEWSVGVDFGTSSTTVYNREGDAKPQPVVFNDRLLRITDPPYLQPSTFYNDFLPPDLEETPFFSLFQKLGNREPDEPLLDGHIYFLHDYEELRAAENIVSDLKWSTNPIEREQIKVFLKQLCFQVAAEAIDNGVQGVHWNFSHPLAFTERDRGLFERIWGEVGATCERETGLAQRIVTPAQSESVVTAQFFASGPQNEYATGGFASGAVCIDIGGETSDISIWQGSELYWQTSLRFAGRHIFLNLFRDNPEFLKNLRVDDKDIELLKEASTGANDKFYAQTDALIQNKGQEWLNKLSTLGDDRTIQPFVQLVSLGVAGLLYYVGLLLNHLSQNEADFTPEIPSIYIGGNGSKILHWMADGNFNHDRIASICRTNLKHVIRSASGFDSDNNRGIEISRYPKEEAAYGLVAEGTDLKPNETQFNILAGETFTKDGEDYGWTSILTTERLKERLSVSKNKLEHIEKFIASFNAGLGKEINMPVDLNETLSDDAQGSAAIKDIIFEKLENIFQGFSDAEPEDISVEPVFILVLKALLEAKTRRWKNIGK
ncbi:MAG: hypothetical protein OXD49_10815 [Candidatus Poribacteria bacterium]|nr:hypothetical protein [Candidatus Poribacteria bacterium]